MESKIYLCKIGKSSKLLEEMILKFTENFQEVIYIDNTYTGSYRNKKILFAVELEELGINLEMEPLISRIYKSAGEKQLENSIGAILIHAKEEM